MTAPVFRPLDDVAYGVPEQVSPLVRRVLANNPSKFTYRGTGTYIVGHGDVVVIDPGPVLDSHRDALADALRGERVVGILITHCHSDHSPLSAWLHDETGAPTFAFGSQPPSDPTWRLLADDPDDDDEESEESDDDASDAADGSAMPVVEESTDYDFVPTHAVADGEPLELGGLHFTGLHTPGHTTIHMCWALEEEQALFTGDHVMGWSTTVVSPPDGNMRDYVDSLRRVAGRNDEVLWPTHGPPRDDGPEYVSALVAHRLQREAGVLGAVRNGVSAPRDIVELLYVDVDRKLHKAARFSVWGHLIKLVDDGLVATDDGGAPSIRSRYVPV